jgi:hypothetical protein
MTPVAAVAAMAARSGVKSIPGVSGVKLINSKIPVVISALPVTPTRLANKSHHRKVVKIGPTR